MSGALTVDFSILRGSVSPLGSSHLEDLNEFVSCADNQNDCIGFDMSGFSSIDDEKVVVAIA